MTHDTTHDTQKNASNLNESLSNTIRRSKPISGEKLRGERKVERIPIKVIPTETLLKKPDWIRVKIPANGEVTRIKNLLREQKLHTVCEEAACPNLSECFSKGTATFMIMGAICTRRCPFCDVAHGKPLALDQEEPRHLAETIQALKLKYVVITSVDRDDLKDSGAKHFVDCIQAVREMNPEIKIEVLVPDFRGRKEVALAIFNHALPDVFNHNIETVPRLYKAARPGSDFLYSLLLLKEFKEHYPHIPTKSGLMVGLGETNEELIDVLVQLRAHKVDMVTIGQYLQPSKAHFPVQRFVTPEEFNHFTKIAISLGFANVASAPMVRSSYHADQQAHGVSLN